MIIRLTEKDMIRREESGEISVFTGFHEPRLVCRKVSIFRLFQQLWQCYLPVFLRHRLWYTRLDVLIRIMEISSLLSISFLEHVSNFREAKDKTKQRKKKERKPSTIALNSSISAPAVHRGVL